MAQLRQDYAQFAARNAEILVIWPDDAAAVRTYCRKEHLPFPNLIDPDHEIANHYAHHASSMSDIPPSKTLWDVLEWIA